jgi:hypothetical protein
MGRPSTYSDEIFDQICTRLENGEVLKAICRDEQMPDRSTVLRWIAADDGKRRKYEAARRACVEFWSDEIIEIATDSSKDTIVDRKGRRGCNHEWVSRSRLRIDTMWKLMRSIAPERYGEKLPEAIVARQIEADEQKQIAANTAVRRIERVIVEPGGGDDRLQRRIAELEAELAGKGPAAPKPPALIEYDPGPLPKRMDKDIAQRLIRLVKSYVHRDDQRAPETVLDEVMTVCGEALVAFYGARKTVETPATV